jgi:3',5'-cyclic AMP phosphodiesterase CpdA
MVAPLTLGFVTDLHFGPEARFEGKLRKLTHRAAELTARVVDAMNTTIRPDALVNLGDDIEDESHDLDLARYRECQAILRRSNAPLINVAGNHDIVHIKTAELNDVWGRSGKLYYSLDIAGWHVVVLHTVERAGVDIRIDAEQLRWLRDDLANAQGPVVVLMHHGASDQDLEDSRWFAKAAHVALVKNRDEFRSIVQGSGKVRAVFNGHLHRNHFDVIRGVPYVTIQSLIENLDDDAPGRAAAAHAVARFDGDKLVVRVLGEDPARYQFHW